MMVVARNVFWLLSSQIATWSISIVMLIVVPRTLGDAGFGQIEGAAAFVAFFSLVARFGSSTFLVKVTARDPERVGAYIFNALVMRVPLVALLSIMAIVLAHLLGFAAETLSIIAVFCLSMALTTCNSVLAAGLQGQQRMGKSALWSAIREYVANIVGLAVLFAHKGLVIYALVFSVANVIEVVANGIQIWPQVRKSARIDWSLWKFIALGGLPFLLWEAVLLVSGTVDVPILTVLAGNATVGWYSLSYKWISLPAFFASIVITASLPMLSMHGVGEITPAFIKMANRALKLVFIVSAPIATGIALVAGDVLSLLHYNSGFSHAIPVMRILALHMPIIGLDMVLGTVLIASDRQKKWTIVGCVAAILNPLCNFVAIPLTMHMFGNGAIGAAIITVATELFMMVGAIYLRPQGVLDRPTISLLLRSSVASLLMIPVVLALSDAWLPLKVAAGATVYVLASLALQTVSVATLRHSSSQVFSRAMIK